MLKKEKRLVGVAIIIGTLTVGAFLYLGSEDEVADTAPVLRPKAARLRPAEVQETPTDGTVASDPSATTPEAVVTEKPTMPDAPYVDPLAKQQEDLIKGFKDKIRLNINLPGDMKFDEIEIEDEVAAMQGNSPDKRMVILAAAKSASPQAVAGFLSEHKARIPLLNNHDFKVSGELRVYAAPKNSGISKITVIPGREVNGSAVYAALLERTDKKGSYVFVMESSPAYFEKYDGDFENMLAGLSVK